MDEPRAKPDDAVAVALTNLDRRITEGLENLDNRCSDRFTTLEAALSALDRLTETKFVTHKTMMEAQSDKVALALYATEKAGDKADAATEKRFDSVNEFRRALSDQSAENLTRREYMAQHEALTDGVAKNTNRLSTLEGRIAGYSAGAAAIGTLAAIAINFVK